MKKHTTKYILFYPMNQQTQHSINLDKNLLRCGVNIYALQATTKIMTTLSLTRRNNPIEENEIINKKKTGKGGHRGMERLTVVMTRNGSDAQRRVTIG